MFFAGFLAYTILFALNSVILLYLLFQLSDCGLMTCYSVQLQSNVTGVDAITKFKTIIQDLIKKLEVRPKEGILHYLI